MEEIEKIKKKLKEKLEIDESDIPIHERFTTEEHIKQIKKGKKNPV